MYLYTYEVMTHRPKITEMNLSTTNKTVRQLKKTLKIHSEKEVDSEKTFTRIQVHLIGYETLN